MRRSRFFQENPGFMMLRAKPARSAEIVMSYRGNEEAFAMAALSLLIWLGAFA